MPTKRMWVHMEEEPNVRMQLWNDQIDLVTDRCKLNILKNNEE